MNWTAFFTAIISIVGLISMIILSLKLLFWVFDDDGLGRFWLVLAFLILVIGLAAGLSS